MTDYDYPNMRKALLAWHDENARDLPWRYTSDPYKIWLSEIMLQQTRAETVVPYYNRFLDAFATVDALARADIDQVLKLWEGLGYYSRARNLWKAAQVVADEYAGVFPRSVTALRKLPGIGPYTAGAIASIAFQLPEPAIDANQMRVLARIFLIEQRLDTPAARKRLDSVARTWIDPNRPGDFNQALMGMGALLCFPTRFYCDDCPVSDWCAAHRTGMQAQLPVLPEKIVRRTQYRAVALVFRENCVLVRRRPENALLGGMWEFPHFLDAVSVADVRAALTEMGVTARTCRAGIQARHVFTHIVWEMHAYILSDATGTPDGARFVDLATLKQLAIPSAMKPFFAQVCLRLEESRHAL